MDNESMYKFFRNYDPNDAIFQLSHAYSKFKTNDNNQVFVN